MALERLQKVLADAGVASRRQCETFIAGGRVTVDGSVVTAMGVKVDPEQQDIRFDGHRVRSGRKIYYAVYKPVGYQSTTDDPQGRPKVTDLLPPTRDRLYPVGRLDADSQGLMILTNDGAFAQHVAHPRHAVAKTYEVEVEGEITDEVAERLTRGVYIGLERPARALSARVLRRRHGRSQVRVVLAEGRKRVLRRMLKALGHKVIHLSRTHIGTVGLGRLKPGESRMLTAAEVQGLLSTPIPARAPAAEAERAHAPTGTGPKHRAPRDAAPDRASHAAPSSSRRIIS